MEVQLKGIVGFGTHLPKDVPSLGNVGFMPIKTSGSIVFGLGSAGGGNDGNGDGGGGGGDGDGGGGDGGGGGGGGGAGGHTPHVVALNTVAALPATGDATLPFRWSLHVPVAEA